MERAGDEALRKPAPFMGVGGGDRAQKPLSPAANRNSDKKGAISGKIVHLLSSKRSGWRLPAANAIPPAAPLIYCYSFPFLPLIFSFLLDSH